MNKDLFGNNKPSIPTTNTVNAAGGTAYKLTDELALAQYAVTGVFANTFYSTAKTDLARVAGLAASCSNDWVARVAIYARKHGRMKDVPVYLVAYLSTQEDKSFFYSAFPYVINNIGQLRSFVQIMRSGALGRKSLGTAPKKAAQRMLASMDAGRIFWQCAGQSPSIQDVLKLVHPRPANAEQDALFGYLLDRDYSFDSLPANVQEFEAFKKGDSAVVPKVDFRRLSSMKLSTTQWIEVAERMTWNQLRLNLNTLQRNGVFNNNAATTMIANKLRDPELVARARCLPFAMYSTVQNIDSAVPAAVKNAMVDALELSVKNAPALQGNTLVLVDSSGSMGSPATGNRGRGATSTMTCSQVAGYFAAALVKANPDTVTVQCFDTAIRATNINPRDSAATIANSLSRHGGGTSISCGLQWALAQRTKFDNIVIISDNESWRDNRRSVWGRIYASPAPTSTATLFAQYRKTKNNNAKLVLWDIQPHGDTQIAGPNTLHVGGFSDSVFAVLDNFSRTRDANAWKTLINQTTN